MKTKLQQRLHNLARETAKLYRLRDNLNDVINSYTVMMNECPDQGNTCSRLMAEKIKELNEVNTQIIVNNDLMAIIQRKLDKQAKTHNMEDENIKY